MYLELDTEKNVQAQLSAPNSGILTMCQLLRTSVPAPARQSDSLGAVRVKAITEVKGLTVCLCIIIYLYYKQPGTAWPGVGTAEKPLARHPLWILDTGLGADSYARNRDCLGYSELVQADSTHDVLLRGLP